MTVIVEHSQINEFHLPSFLATLMKLFNCCFHYNLKLDLTFRYPLGDFDEGQSCSVTQIETTACAF